MKKQMEPTLKTDITENDLVKKLMEFDVTQIVPTGDNQKDPAHTKLQFCVYGTYRWEKMEHNGDAYVAAFLYPVFEHLRVTQVSGGGKKFRTSRREPGHPTHLRSLKRSLPGLWQRKLWERRLRCFKCCFWMKGYANL